MLKQQIQTAATESLKAGDSFTTGVLRMLLASVLTKEKIKNYYAKLRDSAKLRYKKQVFKNLVKCSNRFYKDSKITPFDLWKIAKRQKLICPVTGQKLTTENISLDHIIPRSKGGLNIPSNIRLTTKSVNFSKRNMTDKEFYDLCINVVKYHSPSA